jgi:hypothetical protein
MTKDSDSDKSFKSQCVTVTVTLGSIISSAINGIVAYVAVYFFKPIWDKVISFLKNNK